MKTRKTLFLREARPGGNGGNKNPWNPGSIPDGKK